MDRITNEISSQPITTAQDFQIKEAESKAQDKEGTASQVESSYDAISSQGDTLSISEAGKAANSSDQVVLMSKSDADGTVLQKENVANAAETDDAVSTINLSTYTEIELKQMYLDGDITRIEYDEELESRQIMG